MGLETAIVLSAASTGVSAYGSYQQGKAAEKQGEYNAQIAEREAQIREDNLLDFDQLVDYEVSQMRREYNAFRGQNVVNYVRSGVKLEGGTVEEVMRANLETALEDEYMFRYNAAKEKQMQIDGAAMDRIRGAASRAKGKYQRAAANLQAVGSLLQGGSDAAQLSLLSDNQSAQS
tara:strand:+ start:522 stop:1046 length:525 start_codon:yes stop_codon:yes gene_type:complete